MITSGQAGETLVCQCGRELEVPTMRGLRVLERSGDEDLQRPLWTARQGLVFLGLVIMLSGLTFAGYIYWNMPRIDERLARFEFDNRTPAGTVNSWRELREEPTGQPSPWLQVFMRRIAALRRWIFVGWAVAIVGAVIAAAGLLAKNRGRSRPLRRPA